MDGISTALLLSVVGATGYGDMDEDGYPSWEERAVHFWTNAARVDPEAFKNDYPCQWGTFLSDEQEPKAPLYYSRTLNEAARYHSQDMLDENWFDHDSSPGGDHPFSGRDFGSRVSYWYSDSYTVGENIAAGYGAGFDVVMRGWMCSGGHRANIMSDWYVELGTGFVGSYATQDFGGGAADTAGNLAMGLHEPKNPNVGDPVEVYVDYVGPGPDEMIVFLNGVPWSLDLEYGIEEQGVFATTADLDEGCVEYWFKAIDSDGEHHFPELGSYTIGDCEVDWVEQQLEPGNMGGDDEAGKNNLPGWLQWLHDRKNAERDDSDVSGCTTAPSGLGFGVLGIAAVLLLRRRREL